MKTWRMLGGAVVAVAAVTATAAPAAEEPPGQRVTAKDGGLARAFYRVEISYRGERVTQDNTIVDGNVIRTSVETTKGEYQAKSDRAVLLIAYCVGPHVRFLPRVLARTPGPCAEIRERALRALPEGKRKSRFRKAFKSAREAYEFRDKGRGIILEGEVTNSSKVDVVKPLARAVRGPGGLVSVTCNPDTQTTAVTQLGPQKGLDMILRSGRAGFPSRVTTGVQKTTFGGVQRLGGVSGGVAVDPAGARQMRNSSTCPGISGGPSIEEPGFDMVDEGFVWNPLDVVLVGNKQAKVDQRLGFTQPRGKLGADFRPIVRVFSMKRAPDMRSDREQVIKDRHRWEMKFDACDNPRRARGC